MKTFVKNSVLIAALLIASVSMNAQNTKAVHTGLFNNHLTHRVSDKVNHVSQELSYQMNKMMATLKFKPADLENENVAYISSDEDFSSSLKELENQVKFQPCNNRNDEMTSSSNQMDYMTAASELESLVKFRPAEELDEQSSNENELIRLSAELAETVRFQPQADI